MMIVDIFDDMSLCTEAEVQRMLPLVSAQRRETALKYKHVFGQWACLKSWLMLENAISEDGKSSNPRWLFNEYGKPYIPGGAEFSISHCKQGIAVAVDDRPIGIDIECIRDISPELVARTMNEQEQSAINNQPSAIGRVTEFTKLWTQKEAWLKYKGTGIIDDLQHVLDNTEGVELETVMKENYVYTICYEKR